jgi:hypothetical protein
MNGDGPDEYVPKGETEIQNRVAHTLLSCLTARTLELFGSTMRHES